VTICYDRHFPEGPRCLALNGADVIFVPTATPLGGEMWEIELRGHAVANLYWVGAVNRVGKDRGGFDLEFYGRSLWSAPNGELVATAGTEGDEILYCEIDTDLSKRLREEWGFFRDRRTGGLHRQRADEPARTQGRVAIVTGGSSGLGKEFAQGLAEAGARIVVAARRVELLEQVATELRDEHGVGRSPIPTDICDEAASPRSSQQPVDAFGTVDILVNNAGTTILSPLLEHTLAQWQQVIDVNLTGTFLASREAARVMVPRRSGAIVNISSVFAHGATSEYPVISYYASREASRA
jgi:hypothetical protein